MLIPHGCYRYDVALEAKELKRVVVIETVNKAVNKAGYSGRITRYAETGSDTASPFCSDSTVQLVHDRAIILMRPGQARPEVMAGMVGGEPLLPSP
ncbi:unnamed protein product [Arctogadus glacialis]